MGVEEKGRIQFVKESLSLAELFPPLFSLNHTLDDRKRISGQKIHSTLTSIRQKIRLTVNFLSFIFVGGGGRMVCGEGDVNFCRFISYLL